MSFEHRTAYSISAWSSRQETVEKEPVFWVNMLAGIANFTQVLHSCILAWHVFRSWNYLENILACKTVFGFCTWPTVLQVFQQSFSHITMVAACCIRPYILVVFYVLPTLMHHDADTTHTYTTTSHFTDIVPNSPDFILSLLSEETISTYFNAFGAAGARANDLPATRWTL